MGKGDIIAKMVEKTGATPYSTDKIVTGVLATMIECLLEDGRLTLVNFGTWKVVERKARTARDPRNGTIINVPAKKTIRFTPAKEIKAKVNA